MRIAIVAQLARVARRCVCAVGVALAVGNLGLAPAAWAEEAELPAVNQELGADLAVASGGRTTPGGLRVGGHYLYRMSTSDWFEGGFGFTLGGQDAACFRDRNSEFICDHGGLAGVGLQATAGIRRYFVGQERFAPFVRAGVGVRAVRFGEDDVSGLAIPVVLGAGFRRQMTDQVAVGVGAALEFGLGAFGDALGVEPQAGLVVGITTEVVLD